jgi:hypothetical protein
MSQVNLLYPHFLLQMYKRVKNPSLDLLQKMHLFFTYVVTRKVTLKLKILI